VDLIRFTCSGTESTMAAIRLARAYTGKDKIIKFEGAYHGWSDLHFVSYHPALTMAAGRHNAPRGLPDSTGMPQVFVDQLIIQPFNDLEVIEKTIRDRHFEIAAVLIEPALANCGVIPPVEGYLEGLRKITEQYGVLLIFDEVMTGFRIAPGGAQEYYNIKPDISTFAKVIGGGFPVACFGGTQEVMEIEAKNEVMHGGTYTGSPLALAAADAVLKRIERDKQTMYPRLFELSGRLRDGLVRVIRDAGFHCFGQGIGPLFQVFIGNSDIDRLYNYRDTMAFVRNDIYSAFHAEMQQRGIYCHPSVFERWFLSTEHTDQDIDDTIAAADESIRAVARKLKR
jgi:glutamate-1-semialdehyde 2,1-aminomutase